MFRHIAYGALVLGFAAYVWHGWEGWTSAPLAERVAGAPSHDELPLRTGFLRTSELVAHYVNMGYPWPELRQELPFVKRELPPDTGDPTVTDIRNQNLTAMFRIRFTMPSGRLKWPRIVQELRDRLEPEGIKVLTPPPQPPDAFEIAIPEQEWTGNTFLYHLGTASQKAVTSLITSQGVAIGPDAAVNSAKADDELEEALRRARPEHDDPRLSVPFRPDLDEAKIDGFANAVKAQTGVPMIVDVGIWERGALVKWRGEPRPLRVALDQLSAKMHTGIAPLPVYWRFHDGRVWLLLAGQ